ncbi:MAG TPA: ankyrin repeat domain-containing protein [Vicinamibacterales bacterium]|nr:ankyrin repeat domain-containing protein [Vicinamibacterales bacterium]
MASSSDRSRFVEPLPARPNLEMQQKRAKDLRRAVLAGRSDAIERVGALHPRPPAADAFALADAQLVVARGYGFESWTALRRKIESLTRTPVERFLSALHADDVEAVRELLASHADVRAAINDPISHFDSRPIARATKNLAMLDVLLAHGADLNLKSAWWAGGFGLLEHDITPAEAAPLIARGALVDVFAAAHLGMFDRVRELVDQNPSLVHARGGDGKTPLHCATTVDIASYLLDHGADIDARDVDHESTPAQYLVRDAPDVVRLLVGRGAWFDIFIAAGLRDRALIERCLDDDPLALDHRTWHGKYTVAHTGRRPATRDEIGDRRGDIYRWVFGHNVSAIDAAVMLGDDDIVDWLLQRASPPQQLIAACGRADRAAALAVTRAHPGLAASLTPDQMRLIADKAHANDTAAVALMLEAGFDALARGVDRWEPIRWAAFHGNAEMVRLLLPHRAPLNVPDPTYGGTLLGQCIYGSLHGWHADSGDFATTARLLIEAGERVDPSDLPTGRDDVDAALRAGLAARNP